MKKALALLLPLTLLVSTMSCAEKNKSSQKSENETTSVTSTENGRYPPVWLPVRMPFIYTLQL